MALKLSELVFYLFFFLELLLSLNLARTGLSNLFLLLLCLKLAYTRLDKLLNWVAEVRIDLKLTDHFVSYSRRRVLNDIEVERCSFPLLIICLWIRDCDIDDILGLSLPWWLRLLLGRLGTSLLSRLHVLLLESECIFGLCFKVGWVLLLLQ